MDEVDNYNIINSNKNEIIEYDLPLHRMDIFFDYLTQGIHFDFVKLPANDKTTLLLEGLKEHGFVSEDTKLAHFRVIFGIPLNIKDTPFEPIKWRKNKQLLRYFIYSLFPKETITGKGFFVIRRMFANKYGERMVIPHSDLKRLKQCADHSTLNELLNKFKE